MPKARKESTGPFDATKRLTNVINRLCKGEINKYKPEAKLLIKELETFIVKLENEVNTLNTSLAEQTLPKSEEPKLSGE